MFNVEPYLEKSVQSLLDQSLKDVQIVLVEDVSSDGSREIVKRLAQAHKRITAVYLESNQGLSGARNAGVRKARGEYLAFMDSDDELKPWALQQAVDLLDRSGSDFAVFGYERFNSARRWPAGPWITSLHQKTVERTTAVETPSVMANAVAWSKVIRRSFWNEAGLGFVPGVLYEDQMFSAEAYSKAGAIDIIGDFLMMWRDRDDGSSITQQIGSVEDLERRFEAARATLDILSDSGKSVLGSVRLQQLLAHDFPAWLLVVAKADDEFWRVLVAGLRDLFDRPEFHKDIWRALPPHAAVGYTLILREDRTRAATLFAAQPNLVSHFRTQLVGEDLLSELPFFDDPEADVPLERFALLPRQRPLKSAVRRLYWDVDQLVIEGWAFIEGVDLRLHATEIDVWLVRGVESTSLEVEPLHDVEVSRVSGHRYASYENGGFRARIDANGLAEQVGEGVVEVHVGVRTGALAESGPLSGHLRQGSAGHLIARDLGSGRRVRTQYAKTGALEIKVEWINARVTELRSSGSALHIAFTSRTGRWKALRLRSEGRFIEVPVEALDETKWAAVVALSPSSYLERGTSPWIVRAVSTAGREYAIALSEMDETRAGDGARAFRTQAGNLGLDAARSVLSVVDVAVRGTKLQLELECSGRVGPASFHLDGPVRVEAKLNLREGLNSVQVDLTAAPWGGDSLPIPSGKYQSSVNFNGEVLPLRLSRPLVARTPVHINESSFHARVEPSADGGFVLMVLRPIPPEDRGFRRQRELREWHVAQTAEPVFDSFLLRSYFGENTACNPGALGRLIIESNPNASVYFAVKDHSVAVPPGGIPVVHESREWYRLLANVECIVDNMHQPIYHEKRPHQTVVVTFHGYPFKAMGHPHWENIGLPWSQIQSYDRRADEWDVLVSPAPYATPLLREAFRYDGAVAEIGYPRNDALLRGLANATRSKVRRELGLRDEQTVVLYAPTFRDYLSTDDYSAPLLDLVDMDDVARELGEDFVVLVRGHAFNARSGHAWLGSSFVDVTTYPDVADLYLASDVAVMDYSSARFDFGVTGKPMVFLVPDLERYEEKRGWLLDFEETAPGPQVGTADELVKVLRDTAELRSRYDVRYLRFAQKFLPLEDGHASDRLLEVVRSQVKDARSDTSLEGNSASRGQ